MPLVVETEDDAITAGSGGGQDAVVPIFLVSSVTGEGLDLLKRFLFVLPPKMTAKEREKSEQDVAQFQVDEVFHVEERVVVGGLLTSGVIPHGATLMLAELSRHNRLRSYLLRRLRSYLLRRLRPRQVASTRQPLASIALSPPPPSPPHVLLLPSFRSNKPQHPESAQHRVSISQIHAQHQPEPVAASARTSFSIHPPECHETSTRISHSISQYNYFSSN
ncbi:hypothetical protein FHG87_024632 [Trinorchestia longiramus]|nr:hypothetical protein FHG87_024632 [Trinorchestia longiramus]